MLLHNERYRGKTMIISWIPQMASALGVIPQPPPGILQPTIASMPSLIQQEAVRPFWICLRTCCPATPGTKSTLLARGFER